MKIKTRWTKKKTDEGGEYRVAKIKTTLLEDDLLFLQKHGDLYFGVDSLLTAAVDLARTKVAMDDFHATFAEFSHPPKPLTLACPTSCFNAKGSGSVCTVVKDRIKFGDKEVYAERWRCAECGLEFLSEKQLRGLEWSLGCRGISVKFPVHSSGWMVLKNTEESAAKKREERAKAYERSRFGRA